MYADNTLTPKEAVRLCALGLLAEGTIRYGDLAGSVRHFIDRIQGPSLDVLGTSIELLKYEALVETFDGEGPEQELKITAKGREALRVLLTAKMRATESDHNTLIEALKFRFFHLLSEEDQDFQQVMLIERAETERNRLIDLQSKASTSSDNMNAWLDRQIEELSNRIEWLKAFQAK